MNSEEIKKLLDIAVKKYNNPDFIASDPICIPHLFSKKEDIEIAGLFAAIFAWGQRKTIINKSKELMAIMDFSPHDFILNHSENDLKQLLNFKHRTFNDTDLLYSISALQNIYLHKNGLEDIFSTPIKNELNTEKGIINFHHTFFSLPEFPHRTKKHFSNPISGSTCKRINMYLRWMVRKDNKGVDFGIWKKIKPSQLLCPLDVHVDNISRYLGLISRKQTDWKTVIELTDNLKEFDKNDPVKYDFALFSLGINDFI
jgi:uncharacterized protein (TIGR02757 family)